MAPGLVGKVETVTRRQRDRHADHRPGVRHRRHRGRLPASWAASTPPSARPAICCSSSSTPRRSSGRASSSTPPARPTAGWSRATRPAIPIGTVTRIDLGDGDLDRRIHVKPAADLPSAWTWCRC